MTDTSKEVIERLRALQELDSRIADLDREITSGPKAVESFQRAVAAADLKIAGLDERLKLLRAQVKLRENEAKTGQAKVDRLQEQAMQVKTNREFTAMRTEISSAKADVHRIEEEILKIMEAVETQEKGVVEAQQERAKEQGRFDGEKAKVDAAIDGLRQRRAALAAERPAHTKGLPTEALAAYDRVHKVRGDAMAAVVDSEYCGGCMERLTRNDVLSVLNSVRVVSCKSCSRILYAVR